MYKKHMLYIFLVDFHTAYEHRDVQENVCSCLI